MKQKPNNMIEAKELKLNNYVRIKYDGIDTVDKISGIFWNCIYLRDMGGEWEFEDIEPIELTPEILENVKFAQWGTRKENFSCGIEPEDGEYRFWASLWEYSDYAGTANLCAVKYVHQLQNLYFSLTGKELEITL